MRRVFLVLAGLVVAIVALSNWVPGLVFTPAPTPTRTPLPEGFTLIPTFVPSFPCELQNVDVYDEQLCRSEWVHERVLVEGDGVLFIQRDNHLGTGCWTGVNTDIHELRVCERESGAVTLLSDELTSELLLSPDGEWYAFGAMNRDALGEDAFNPRVYRVRRDGTGLQRLDTQGFPQMIVGAPLDLRWIDDEWLALTLWDGTEGGYHPYRLKADGSGFYELLPQLETTQAP